ncbi:Major Facilitator Superfamily transporter [Aciduliprofundum sp. MAR08-339]|uniref:MFS transporter n=1 Tax=Aciduliprofundum sp. (strain MAR08-339) TaxID=673860 RepID=UPI0002A4B9A3|nr:Major Facilitator Superfamily transporter [Aciduliprofundum sp. MAR08-339]
MTPKKRGVSFKVILAIAFVGFSMSTGWAINKALSFKLLQSYTTDPFVIGSILALQGLMGIVVPILMGYYSDTYRSGRGRRTTFILWGAIASTLSIFAVYFSFIASSPLILFSLLLAVFYFFMYFFVAQYRSLMPDVVPSGQRGKSSGVITFFEWGGNLLLFGLVAIISSLALSKIPNADTSIDAMIMAHYLWIPFAIVGFFLVVSGLIVYFRVKEPAYPEEAPEESLGEYLRAILADRDFVKFYSAQILWWLSFEFIAVFLYGILESILHTQKVLTLGAAIMALFNITVLVGALIGGPLYDRIGRRKSIVIGGLVFLLPFIWGWFVTTSMEITEAIGIAGIGWGMLMATSWPVIGDLLNRYEKEFFNGRYYGFFEATKSFPILIAGVVGGAIVHLAGGNYKVLFPVGALFVIIALPLIWAMKHLDREKSEPSMEDAIEATEEL